MRVLANFNHHLNVGLAVLLAVLAVCLARPASSGAASGAHYDPTTGDYRVERQVFVQTATGRLQLHFAYLLPSQSQANLVRATIGQPDMDFKRLLHRALAGEMPRLRRCVERDAPRQGVARLGFLGTLSRAGSWRELQLRWAPPSSTSWQQCSLDVLRQLQTSRALPSDAFVELVLRFEPRLVAEANR